MGLNWKVDLHCLPFTGLTVDLKMFFHNPRTLDVDLGHWLDHVIHHMTRTFIMWPGWGPQFHVLDIHNAHSCLQLFEYPLPQLPFFLLCSDYTHNQRIASPWLQQSFWSVHHTLNKTAVFSQHSKKRQLSPHYILITQWRRQLCSNYTVKKTAVFCSHSEEYSCVLLTRWRRQLCSTHTVKNTAEFYSHSEEYSCVLLTVKNTAVFYSHREEDSRVLLTQWKRQLCYNHTGKKTAICYNHPVKKTAMFYSHTKKLWQQCSCLHTHGPRKVHSDPTPPFKASPCQTSQITGALFQTLLHAVVSMVRDNATWPGYVHYIRWHTQLQGITGTSVNPSAKLLQCGMPPWLQHPSNTWLFLLEVMKTVDWLSILWIACCFLVCFSIPVCSSSDMKAKHCTWMYVLQTLMCS